MTNKVATETEVKKFANTVNDILYDILLESFWIMVMEK